MVQSVPLVTGVEPYPGYRLEHPLGRGAFAEVWAASKGDGGRVALKFLSCDRGRATPQEIRALQAVRGLRHPNLVRIEQIWGHLGYIVIAMELADGSASDVLAIYRDEYGTAIPADYACALLRQAADALDFLNARQHQVNGRPVAIQHCDIKPSNMLVFGDTLKLSDFGLTSLLSSSQAFQPPAGTLDYTAPEVFQGRVSDRTDQYALAVTYCELRGRLPFADTPEKFRRDYVRPNPDLSMLSAEERPVVARALAPQPADRWPSCAELIDRLAHLIRPQLAVRSP